MNNIERNYLFLPKIEMNDSVIVRFRQFKKGSIHVFANLYAIVKLLLYFPYFW